MLGPCVENKNKCLGLVQGDFQSKPPYAADALRHSGGRKDRRLPIGPLLRRDQRVIGVTDLYPLQNAAPQHPVIPDVPEDQYQHRSLWNTSRHIELFPTSSRS